MMWIAMALRVIKNRNRIADVIQAIDSLARQAVTAETDGTVTLVEQRQIDGRSRDLATSLVSLIYGVRQ